MKVVCNTTFCGIVVDDDTELECISFVNIDWQCIQLYRCICNNTQYESHHKTGSHTVIVSDENLRSGRSVYKCGSAVKSLSAHQINKELLCLLNDTIISDLNINTQSVGCWGWWSEGQTFRERCEVRRITSFWEKRKWIKFQVCVELLTCSALSGGECYSVGDCTSAVQGNTYTLLATLCHCVRDP